MLTFLRKIRKSLVMTGSTKKYIIYAFGEIALVVIGILIALQINNWNEFRKYTENEAYMLNEILNNLGEDAEQIKSIIERRSTAKNAVSNLLNDLSQANNVPVNPEDVGSFLSFERYYPLNNSFEMMKSTGLKLSNKKLRTAISRYYDFEQNKVTQSIKDIENVFLNIVKGGNPIRSNISQAKTGSNVYTKVVLKKPDDPVFREALLNELIPFQDNNGATLENVKIFYEINQNLIELVKEETNSPRMRKYLTQSQ
jgi:hypothetical protein